MTTAILRRLKYRLRRFFWSRRHSQEVKDIRINQLLLKRANNGIEQYSKLMCHGYLGGTLWENYHLLLYAKKYYEREISNLKEKVRHKQTHRR